MGDLAWFIGSLFGTGLFVAVFLWLVGKIGLTGKTAIFAAVGLSLVGATVAAGYGEATGNAPPDFAVAFLSYLLAHVIWLGFFLFSRARTGRVEVPPQSLAAVAPPASEPAKAEVNGGKRALYGAVALVVGIGAFFLSRELVRGVLAPSAAPSMSLIREQLQQAVADLKKTMPISLDKMTTVVDVTLVGTTMTYHQLLQTELAEIDMSLLEATVRKNVCGNSEMRKGISVGVAYEYRYAQAISKKPIGVFTISSCPT